MAECGYGAGGSQVSIPPPDTSELEHKETAAATLVKRETEAKDG